MAKKLTNLYKGTTCADCGAEIPVGDPILWYGRGRVYGIGCHTKVENRNGNGKTKPKPKPKAKPKPQRTPKDEALKWFDGLDLVGLENQADPLAGKFYGYRVSVYKYDDHLNLYRKSPQARMPTRLMNGDREALREALVKWCEKMEAKALARREKANARKQRNHAVADKVQVGTIFYTSWGYNQTNVDFYEVVEKPSKMKVVVRRIAAVEEEGSHERVLAEPGKFLDPERWPPKTCLIQAGWKDQPTIKVDRDDHGTIWDGTSKYRTHWSQGH